MVRVLILSQWLSSMLTTPLCSWVAFGKSHDRLSLSFLICAMGVALHLLCEAVVRIEGDSTSRGCWVPARASGCELSFSTVLCSPLILLKPGFLGPEEQGHCGCLVASSCPWHRVPSLPDSGTHSESSEWL